jgi:hypothetical protein
MKILTYCSVFVLLALISFPIPAEAFSWFSHSSDSSALVQNPGHHSGGSGHVQNPGHQPAGSGHVQNPGQSAPLDQTRNISPQAVPEPPTLLLMGIGIGLFAIFSMIKRFRGHNASREKAL